LPVAPLVPIPGIKPGIPLRPIAPKFPLVPIPGIKPGIPLRPIAPITPRPPRPGVKPPYTGKGRPYYYADYATDELVQINIRKYCAVELLNALIIALGIVPPPKKKKGKGGKGGK
jgi:hypothetical protein